MQQHGFSPDWGGSIKQIDTDLKKKKKKESAEGKIP